MSAGLVPLGAVRKNLFQPPLLASGALLVISGVLCPWLIDPSPRSLLNMCMCVQISTFIKVAVTLG